MADWTFFTNHARVLMALANHPDITARDLATFIRITERSVRNIIADLESEDYIVKLKEGRRISYKINTHLSFWHPTQQDHSIAKFLKALGWKLIKKTK